MDKKSFAIGIAIFFIGISIIIGGYFIGDAIKSVKTKDLITTPKDNKVMNLSQVAEYLNIPEEEVKGVIRTEKNKLEKTGSFSGKMFPYFTINSKQYFYKVEIDEWLMEVTSTHREYNTTEGWVLQ